MSFGLEWINNSGKSVISAERYGLVYIGEATFANTQKPDAYTELGGGGAGGYISGVRDPFYIYTIVSATTPVCFLQLGAYPYTITSVANTGGNNWEIIVGGNNWTTAPKIKCFARLVGMGGSGVGVRVFDASGTARTWDSTEKMLVIKQRDNWATFSDSTTTIATQSITLSGFTNPYVMSLAEATITGTRSSSTTTGGFYTVTESVSGWKGSSTTLTRGSLDIVADKFKDDAITRFNQFTANTTYIIEGNNYT